MGVQGNRVRLTASYVDNESGAKLARPELFRLLSDSRVEVSSAA